MSACVRLFSFVGVFVRVFSCCVGCVRLCLNDFVCFHMFYVFMMLCSFVIACARELSFVFVCCLLLSFVVY